MLKDGVTEVIEPTLTDLIKLISDLATSLAEYPMLSRTHGQAASTTTMGKELANTVTRLQKQKLKLLLLIFLKN